MRSLSRTAHQTAHTMLPQIVRNALLHQPCGCGLFHQAAAAAAAAAAGRAFSAAAAGGDGPSTQELRASFEHCAQLVREHDPDNFLWVVQLPKELRLRVLALRAFNLEMLLVGEAVKSREQLVMQIRYQWWRDALGRLSDTAAPPPQHPVLLALWAANRESRLSRYQLRRLLDTREGDALQHQTPLTLEELERYAEGSASQLLYLQLAAAGVVSRDADHAASHLGKAIGISLLLRGTPFQAARRRSYLPVELCSQHGVSQEDVYRGNVTEGLRDVTLAVASAAMGHLREARQLAAKLPAAAPQVMQQGVLAGQYLAALEKAGFNAFDPQLASSGGASPLRRVLALKWNMLRGTF